MDMPAWLASLTGLPAWAKLLILAALAAASFALGHSLARRWRSEDYGMRLSVMIGAVTLSAAICLLLWPPKLGIDLSGGVILVYEIDEEATRRQQEEQEGIVERVKSSDIVPFILLRINPSGLEDVVVRPYGDDQVEVIIPHVEAAAIDRIKSIISTAGFLEFRIVANPTDHDYIIEAAMNQQGRSRLVKDEDGRSIGLWADLGTLVEKGPQGNIGDYRMTPRGTIFRNGETGEVMTDEQGNLLQDFLPQDPSEQNALFERFRDEENGLKAEREYFEETLGIRDIEILMAADDGYNVRGDHVGSVAAGVDESGFPSMNFTMTSEGAILFQGLTGENTPDPQTGFKRRLGILMDNSLISAPELRSMISRNGQITGRFSDAEVTDLVQIVRGGSLPAALTPQPTSESQISPLLGAVTIRQSAWAIAISLGLVLIFMLVYYRFAGIIACGALVINLLLILAVMILLNASFTLPGMAGLVLTVGMSVDANILIFERIREELSRGAKVRMALRNGFARATTTIVDANVTTLITAIVLYAIGTDLIRGFAVTLILGILMSMFTAIYCSRTIFELGDRRHWYRELNMLRLLGETRINFLSKGKIALAASAIFIVLGLGGVIARGVNIFDIDLVGGTSVQVLFTQPLTESEVRERLEKERFLAVYREVVAEERQQLDPDNRDDAASIAELDEELEATDFDLTLSGLPAYTDDAGNPMEYGRAWKIDTSFPSVERLEKAVQRIFTDGDESLLVMREVAYSPPESIAADAPPATSNGKAAPQAPPRPSAKVETAPISPASPEDPRANEPRPPAALGDEEESPAPASTDGAGRSGPASPLGVLLATQALGQAETAQDEEVQPRPPVAPEDDEDVEAPAQPEARGDAQAPPAKRRPAMGSSRSVLEFRYNIDDDALKYQLVMAAGSIGIELDADAVNVEPVGATFQEWSVTLPLPPDAADQVLNRLQRTFAQTPVFPSASKIGGKVAADMQRTAAMALLLSLVGIVIYLWIRFQRVAYGLAAVAAVVHDVLVMLGAVAISYWLAGVFGFLLIENFKISLPVVAAFLTIIGYSLNDTIVIFDRIREVKGKSPRVTQEMVNSSLNQTLSRTLLTSLTTLIVVGILYAFGGQGIHGFAFAMLIGIVAGTYSTIYIACPVLLWLTERGAQKPASAPPAVTEEKVAKVTAR